MVELSIILPGGLFMRKSLYLAVVFTAAFGIATAELPPLGLVLCFAVLTTLLFERFVWRQMA